MRKEDRKKSRRRAPKYWGYLKWVAALGTIGLIVYALSQNAGVAFDEDDIGVVSFDGLDPTQKRETLLTANRARCPCGCGMNLAQCVATDMTCPLREGNVEKIRGMVAQARQARPSS